jgi:hypothetical protein
MATLMLRSAWRLVAGVKSVEVLVGPTGRGRKLNSAGDGGKKADHRGEHEVNR